VIGPLDILKLTCAVFGMVLLMVFGSLVFAAWVESNESNPTHGYWLLVRSEGDWVIDDELAPGLPERLSIELDTTSLPERGLVPFGRPVGKGSVKWSDGSCPVTMQFGTPNNPGIPDLWVQPSEDGLNSAFPWNARERGFAVSLDIVNGDRGRHPRETDPGRDRLHVVFDDHVHQIGENRAENEVSYVRQAR
jgi:hypothetical protein